MKRVSLLVACLVAAGGLALTLRAPGSRAAPPLLPAQPRAQRVSFVEVCGPGDYESLADMCVRSSTVVVGRVLGIVRVHLSPPNAPSACVGTVITVYRVAVEQYLRDDGAPHRPAAINVALLGGVLGGRAYFVENEPGLMPGARYLLFLRVARSDIPGMCAGVWGITLRKGECSPVSRRAVILLENGRTAAPRDAYQQMRPWRFEFDSEPLLGIPEAQALQRVREVLAGAPYRYEPGIDL